MSRTLKNYPASFKKKAVIAALRDDRLTCALDNGLQAQKNIGFWLAYYNQTRPHSTFNGQTPMEALENKNEKSLYGHAHIMTANDQTLTHNLTKDSTKK